MRHRKKKKILSRKKSAREALLRNLAINFILAERIKTTTAKAKFLRPYIENLITRAKQPNLANRRYVFKFLQNEKAVNKLFNEIAPRYKEKNGGYTKILKMGRRKGDGAELSLIKLV